MATTTYSEITDIVEYIHKREGRLTLPITEIDGISCQVTIHSLCRNQTPDEKKKIMINILARYKDTHLHHKCFEGKVTHEEIVAYIRTIPDMKYCKTITQFCIDPTEKRCYHEKKFMEEIFNSVDEVVNYKTEFSECPVCLDICYTTLDCGHHICLPCESKMKKETCPQCRERYTRYQSDGDY